ncbi:hypothetical protein ACOJBM_36420 [Rhizobium beringeri]|jgi:hypothetical protein|uniref:Uncharacterized protein n=2 Tax=Rhizobium TaxID=379 RepID=A0A444I6H3_RHILE|nr:MULTISPECIES: hypothetical protein [Rhizobium]RWX07208.1 hypothetical protein EHI45_26325 [Rhizobium leguminosarum]RWX33956.1 hypothetical protein EHI47_08090 [Rhizobium leguminosarum]TAU37902.1 hypothetical protein ELI43_31480 [Rhizobium leguminosarum]TBC54818.1 hypothetical protein ELH27_35475 [Rhizobium leguminosarum]TBC86750.1 hypothetical protein ELH26_36445 [Rhizobium leguminosarum]
MSEALKLASEADVAIIDVRLGDGLTGPSIARSSFAFGLGVVYLPANANLVEEPDGQSVITKPGR